MLIQLHSDIESNQAPILTKTQNGQDVSNRGSFSFGETIRFCLRIPRKLGIAAPVMRLHKDGEDQETDIPFSFYNTADGFDFYELSLNTVRLCRKDTYGLFYYTLVFVRGWETLFSDSINNVDMSLSNQPGVPFRMLIHEKQYATPTWFHGGTMYHIFVDRFCKGEGKVSMHKEACLNPDWHHGIPQYAKHPGEALSNNVFFGGNLWGIIEKLDYLSSLGITVLYLSPIFKAYSNHRYDTGDYETVDPFLGGEDAFDRLINEAHARGIRVILDGVFNHTGDDSRYFNKRGNYPDEGAYQSPDSPYAKWFSFREYPDSYECWWNIEIMPRLQHTNEACRHYFTTDGGIAQKWLLRGADGWRLDVADELSDDFLDELRQTVKATTDGNGLLIGEVWENAADKIAYGKRRRYLSGKQLDSVMNYPFRNAILALLCDNDPETFYNVLTEIYSSYPKTVCDSLMNLLGTHDTERILTRLGDEGTGEQCRDNDEFAHLRLSPLQRKNAIQKLKLASALQFTVFGVPSVYYGDEAGIEGYHDPFCRLPFPWGEEEPGLLEHYRALGKLRAHCAALKNGDFRFIACNQNVVCYERNNGNQRLCLIANIGAPHTYTLVGNWQDALSGEHVSNTLPLGQYAWRILLSTDPCNKKQKPPFKT